MFWRYNLITGSCIETLLDKEDVTLKELLEEEDILQECKAQTKKLLDFLIRPEVLQEMVSLIIEEPTEEGDEKLRYRFSNRACELLTFDIAQINDALAGDESLLQKLYDFLSTELPLNPLLASFFSKTMGLLIIKKTAVMQEFFKDKDFITLILNHLDTSAIMDLLLRFLAIEDSEMQLKTIQWLHEQKLVQKLISRIDVQYGEEINCNASHALCDIIKVSREQMSLLQEKAELNLLLESIESVEMVSELLNHMFRDSSKESALVNGILVLLSLLVFKKHSPGGIPPLPGADMQADNAPSSFLSVFRNGENEQMTDLDAERLSRGVYNVVNAIIPRLGDFHKLLLQPPVKPAIILTTGCLDPPLGNCRLEVASLLNALLYTNNHLVNIKLAENQTVIILLDMFFKYCWNNFLHTQVEQIIGRIASNLPTVDEEGNKVHPLLDQILTVYKLTVKMLECFEEDPLKPAPGTHRKGYIGHLTKIANTIAQNSENGCNSAFITEKLKELPEDHQKKWEEFVSEKLVKINQNNKVYVVVCGLNTVSSSNDEESVNFRNVPFGKDSSAHLGFSEYQMHEMTNNFVDQFGFNDDEFADADENLIFTRNAVNPIMQNFQPSESNNARSAELFDEVCRVKFNPSDTILWDDQENTTNFSSSFRLRKSSSENSSDSDEESQVFESENSTLALSNEEIKMDVDNHNAMFASDPMDVAPATISNPWGTTGTTQSSSDDQQNWADFSNFASFDNLSSQQSDPSSSVAMETSEPSSTEKVLHSPETLAFNSENKVAAEFSSISTIEMKSDLSSTVKCDVKSSSNVDKPIVEEAPTK